MVGAMLVLLALLGALVAFRSLTRPEVEVRPTAIDYLAAVDGAQANGIRVFYPQAGLSRALNCRRSTANPGVWGS
jgi:hypothetical protein